MENERKKANPVLSSLIIRPKRRRYLSRSPGWSNFSCNGTKGKRQDLSLQNSRGEILRACHFFPFHIVGTIPTVVYLHGNSGCLRDARTLLPLTVAMGMSLFAFDFSGSGNSGGDYVTLGVREQFDIQAVVTYLESIGVSQIVLWGYSMGAAAALMYAGSVVPSDSVKALILDSPFSSVRAVIEHRVGMFLGVLRCFKRPISSAFICCVRKDILRKCDVRVDDMNVLAHAGSVPPRLPALFVHGEHDQVVPVNQGYDLFSAYTGRPNIWAPIASQGHTDMREEEVRQEMSSFAISTMLGESSISFIIGGVPEDAYTKQNHSKINA